MLVKSLYQKAAYSATFETEPSIVRCLYLFDKCVIIEYLC